MKRHCCCGGSLQIYRRYFREKGLRPGKKKPGKVDTIPGSFYDKNERKHGRGCAVPRWVRCSPFSWFTRVFSRFTSVFIRFVAVTGKCRQENFCKRVIEVFRQASALGTLAGGARFLRRWKEVSLESE